VQLLEEKLHTYQERKDNFVEKMTTQSKKINQLEQRVKEQETTVHTEKGELEKVQQAHQDKLLHYRNAAAELANDTRAQQEKQEKKKELDELKQQLTEIETKQEPLNQTINEVNETIQSLTEEVTSFEEKEKQTEKQLHELEVSYASLQQQYQNKTVQLEKLTEQMNEIKEHLQQQESTFQSQMSEQELQDWKNQLDQDMEQYEKQQDETSRTLEEKRTLLVELKQQVEDDTHETKGLNGKLVKEAERIQEKEIQANRLDVTLDNHLTALQTEYTMTFEKAAS